ncbi:MAG TPA: lysylphosphatidylglycerol synthase transmembrane domain-containing protein [Xanthobacteraceae bacterium]|jgi:hypothetical protein
MPDKKRLPSAKAALFAIVQIAASIVLLGAIARLLNPAELEGLFRDTAMPWLALAFGILVLQQILTAERWRLVSSALSAPPHTFFFFMFWQGVGSLCSMVLPSIIGADLVRTYALSRRTGIGTVIRVVLVDRALGLLALAALVVIGFATAPAFFVAHSLMLVPLLIALAGASTYVILTQALPRWRTTNPIIASGRILGLDLCQAMEGNMRAWCITASLTIHVLSVAAFIVLGKAVRIEGIDPLDYLRIVPGALLVTIIPFSIGGWGLRESAVIIGFGLLGMNAERAFALSVVFGVLSMISAVVPLLFGIRWFFESPADPVIASLKE